MAEVIQADYEQLVAVAKRFENRATQISDLHQQMRQQVNRLRRSWSGAAATAFTTEFDQKVDPAMLRLIAALQQAGMTTQKISEVAATAEREAAALFKSEATTAVPLAAKADNDDSAIPDWLKDLLEVAVLGDFSDKNSILGLLAQIGIGFIPIVGQIADIRDIIAGIKNILEGEPGAAVFLVIAVLAIIPGLDALKAAKVLKPIFRALGNQGVQELVEFIAKNPGEIGRVARVLGNLVSNPQLAETIAKNPDVASAILRSGSPELVEALGKNPGIITDLTPDVLNAVTRHGADGLFLLERGSPELIQSLARGGDAAVDEALDLSRRYGADGNYIALNYHRYEDMIFDPDKGKITPGSRREAEVALALENRFTTGAGQGLTPPLTRPAPIIPPPAQTPPSPDFIDGNGQKWDVKGFYSTTPSGQGAFQVNDAMQKINKEISRGENVILDTQNMTPAHIAQLRTAITNAGLDGNVVWYP